MKRFILLNFFVMLIITSGCSRFIRTTPLSVGDLSIAEIRHRIEQNNLNYHSMKARADIMVESPRASFTASSNIIIKKPDSIFIQVRAPFGIGVGSLFINQNQFLLYNSFQNSVYTGELDSLKLDKFLAINLNLENIIQAFSGIQPLDFYENDSLAIDRNQFLILGLKDNKISKYWIDPKKFVVTGYQLLNDHNELLITVEYKQFEKKDHVILPRLIQIFQPGQKTRLTILYTSRKANCKLSEKDFFIKIPDQAEWIQL